MCEPWRDPQLILVFRRKHRTDPFAESGGGATDINGYVKDLTLDHAYKFALSMRRELVMQAPKHPSCRFRMVILNEVRLKSGHFLEDVSVEALIEEATLVAEHLRGKQEDFRYCQGCSVHQNTFSLSRLRRYWP